MTRTFNIYYNNNKIENKYSNNLAKSIFELGLKQGDTITSYSFNYFKDEDTPYLAEKLEYQNTLLKIEKVEVVLIDTWNSGIKSIIEIFISDIN